MIRRGFRVLCDAILRFYPDEFRYRHGQEIVDTIEARLAATRERRGVVGVGWHGVKELRGLSVGAVTERRREPRPATDGGSRGWWPAIGGDVRCALRGWKRHPGYALAVVLTLAVGIGANTAIFSVVNGVLLRPLGYRDADRLALVWDRFDWLPTDRSWVHDLQVRALRHDARRFEGFAAMEMVSGRILGGADPLHTNVARVSANFFALLGVTPQLGRVFREGEDRWGAPWVVMLTHEYWVREFDRDPEVIGKKLVVGFPEMTVIGVLPESFDYRLYEALGRRTKPELWIPHQIDYAWWDEAAPGRGVAVLARVAPHASLDEARDELRRLSVVHGERFFDDASFSYELVPLLGDVVREVRPALLVLLGAVACVLLIAVANIVTLVLTRTHYRVDELAVRQALGASRWRIARQLATESVLPAVVGGALGLAVAAGSIDALLAAAPFELPRVGEIAIDTRVMWFTVAATMGAGLVAGIVPALLVPTRPRGRDVGGSGGPHGGRTRHGLAVVQLALSVVLLAGAALMMRSFAQLQRVDPGFRPSGAFAFDIFLMREYPTPESRNAFFAALSERVAALPGVEAVGATTALPLHAPTFGPVFRMPVEERLAYSLVPGRGVEPDPDRYPSGAWVMADINAARPGYFAAAGIAVRRGSDFVEADGVTVFRVVIDELLADSLWPGANPLGRSLWVHNVRASVRAVVDHTHHHRYGRTGRPQLYIPYAVLGTTQRTSVVVRAASAPEALMPAIRAAVAELDSLVPIADVRPMTAIVREATAEARFALTLMSLFASAALGLAAVGLYGVLAFAVAHRRKEIAVRVAVGAPRRRLAWWVIGEGARLAAIGCVLGVGGAMALGTFARSLLYGVPPRDPVSLGVAALVLAAVTVVVASIPVRRALNVDPVTVLRSE